MKRLIWTLAVAATLAAPLPAAAQHAVPRGGGDGGGSSSGGSSGGGGGGGGTSSSSGGGGGGSTWSSGDSGGRTAAPPRHPTASGRSGGGSGSGGGTASSRGGSGGSRGGGSRSGDPDRVVGSTGDGRTRDGRPIVGYAIPRGPGAVVPSGRPGGDYNYFPRGNDWYYSPFYYSRYSPFYFGGYGASMWGLGYIWDPFWFGPGYADPWDSPYGGGYGGGGYGGGYGGGGIYAGGGGGSAYDDDESAGEGGLRIKVKPREARVMVDGTFAGTVDDFDGNFQRLRLDAGRHKIELQAEGFDVQRFDVMIVEGQTITYKGKLRER